MFVYLVDYCGNTFANVLDSSTLTLPIGLTATKSPFGAPTDSASTPRRGCTTSSRYSVSLPRTDEPGFRVEVQAGIGAEDSDSGNHSSVPLYVSLGQSIIGCASTLARRDVVQKART